MNNHVAFQEEFINPLRAAASSTLPDAEASICALLDINRRLVLTLQRYRMELQELGNDPAEIDRQLEGNADL